MEHNNTNVNFSQHTLAALQILNLMFFACRM
jgi:hypothetical protein